MDRSRSAGSAAATKAVADRAGPMPASLKGAIEGTSLIRDQVRAVSTWPWQPATLSGVISVLLAPFAIWLITRGLELAIF